jgi:hypothetical protein
MKGSLTKGDGQNIERTAGLLGSNVADLAAPMHGLGASGQIRNRPKVASENETVKSGKKRATGEIRTPNPRITNAALCQLKLRWH